MNLNSTTSKATKKVRIASIYRRRFLQRILYGLAACGLAACRQPTERAGFTAQQAQVASTRLSPTPTCGDYALTPSQTPGPFYTPNSPQRQSLLTPNAQGTKLTITGRILTTDCTPIANCLVDVWQTDAQGNYDNEGNNLRGHQFTGSEGRYRIETIVPGLYPGRTRHIHIKVRSPNHPLLTTQLYLPDEPLNEEDFLFQPALLMAVQDTDEDKQAYFDFVLG